MKNTKKLPNYYNITIHIFLFAFVLLSIILSYKLNTKKYSNPDEKSNKKSCLENYFTHNRFYLEDNSTSQVEIKNGWLNFTYNDTTQDEFKTLEKLLDDGNLIKYKNDKVTESARLNDKDIKELLELINHFVKKYFTVIEMEEYGCDNTNCQSYKATIYSNGTVKYTGQKDVETLGEKTYKISEEKLNQIIDALYNLDYFNLQTNNLDNTGKCTKIAVKINGIYKKSTICSNDKKETKFETLKQTIKDLSSLNKLL